MSGRFPSITSLNVIVILIVILSLIDGNPKFLPAHEPDDHSRSKSIKAEILALDNMTEMKYLLQSLLTENEILKQDRDTAMDKYNELIGNKQCQPQLEHIMDVSADQWQTTSTFHAADIRQSIDTVQNLLFARKSDDSCLNHERNIIGRLIDDMKITLDQWKMTNMNESDHFDATLKPADHQCIPCTLHLSIEGLRDQYGGNQDSIIFGSQSDSSARKLYHKLLPDTDCIHNSEQYQHLTMCEKAEKAFKSRKVVKTYIREINHIWSSLFTKIYDWGRHGRVDGISAVDLWNKKAKATKAKECVIGIEGKAEAILWNNDRCENVCAALLVSSSKTNAAVDKWHKLSRD